MRKTELSTGEGHLVNNSVLSRSLTTDLDSLCHQMATGWESDQRLTIQADPKIFRSTVHNLHWVHKEGKDHASFRSNISEDHQINRDLIIWISSSKSNRRLSLRPDPNIYKPMVDNPYQIHESGKRGACCRGDSVRGRWIL